jgi:hypothetical protein
MPEYPVDAGDPMSSGLVVLASISVVVALAAHAVTHRYFLASLVAGVASALLFQGIALLLSGEGSTLSPGAMAVSLAAATTIAFAIGIPFAVVRVARKGGHGPSSHYDPDP